MPTLHEVPRGRIVSGDRTFEPIIVHDFQVDAPVGTIRHRYPSMNHFNGFTDTSKQGVYDPDSVLSVHDGMLDFHLRTGIPSAHAQSGGAPASPAPLVACVMPDDYTAITYGRCAFRYRSTATEPGFKLAAMFWPVDDDWDKGEIDFVEFDLTERTRPASAIPGSLGQGSGGGMRFAPPTEQFAPHDSTDWHVGICEWTPEAVRVFHDDVLLAEILAPEIPVTPMRVELQAETFIGRGTTPPSASGHLYVDWIATYRMVG